MYRSVIWISNDINVAEQIGLLQRTSILKSWPRWPTNDIRRYRRYGEIGTRSKRSRKDLHHPFNIQTESCHVGKSLIRSIKPHVNIRPCCHRLVLLRPVFVPTAREAVNQNISVRRHKLIQYQYQTHIMSAGSLVLTYGIEKRSLIISNFPSFGGARTRCNVDLRVSDSNRLYSLVAKSSRSRESYRLTTASKSLLYWKQQCPEWVTQQRNFLNHEGSQLQVPQHHLETKSCPLHNPIVNIRYRWNQCWSNNRIPCVHRFFLSHRVRIPLQAQLDNAIIAADSLLVGGIFPGICLRQGARVLEIMQVATSRSQSDGMYQRKQMLRLWSPEGLPPGATHWTCVSNHCVQYQTILCDQEFVSVSRRAALGRTPTRVRILVVWMTL